jgi:polyhydroxyalkanoate synthesis regulator phasin
MEQYLQQMSLPTRKEVVSLAERLTKIEMRLDDLDAKLDEVLDHLKATK